MISFLKIFVVIVLYMVCINCCNCQNATNRCMPNPCWNNGTCNPNTSQSLCSCPTGYSGVLCDTNGCVPNSPCLNGGSCSILTNGSVQCTCRVGYRGRLCEIDACTPSPCQNGGTCYMTQNGTAACTCNNYVTGQYCQYHPCSSNPCKNGGTCSFALNQNYACSCRIGYSGNQCEKDSCSASPCAHGGTCSINQINGSFTCACPNRYYGPTCNSDACDYYCRGYQDWSVLYCDFKVNSEKIVCKGSCFSTDSYVTLKNGNSKSILDVQVNDIIKASNAGKVVDSKVVDIWHVDKNNPTNFLQLKCENGESITITDDHLLKANGVSYRKAGNVRIGDTISFYSRYNNSLIETKVVDISKLVKNEFIAPITDAGTILVNGFDASCYAAIENQELLHFLMKIYLTLSEFFKMNSILYMGLGVGSVFAFGMSAIIKTEYFKKHRKHE